MVTSDRTKWFALALLVSGRDLRMAEPLVPEPALEEAA
jgi:hypothetical protein